MDSRLSDGFPANHLCSLRRAGDGGGVSDKERALLFAMATVVQEWFCYIIVRDSMQFDLSKDTAAIERLRAASNLLDKALGVKTD